MKKMLFSVLIMGIILSMASCSCGEKEKEDEIYKQRPTYEMPTFNYDQPVSTTDGEINLREMSLNISKLVDVDGISGEINLNSTGDEIRKILNDNHIPYKIVGEDFEDEVVIIAEDGSIYHTGYDMDISINITKEGLFRGDNVDNLKKLYGEPDYIYGGYQKNVFNHVYNIGKIPCKVANDKMRTAVLEISVAEEIVITIRIRYLTDYEEAENWFDQN